MSLIILFEPELVTINSVPYSLCPCTDCRGALTLGTIRHRRTRSLRPRLTTPSRCYRFTSSHRVQTDGAGDEEQAEEGSHDPSDQKPKDHLQKAKPKVRFLPPPSESSLRGTASSFANPLSGTSLLQRRESDGSDVSSLFGSPAFSTHRDTLARLNKVLKPEIHSDEEDSAYTTASSDTLQRPGLYRHRDTLARLHFQRNQAVALPPNGLVKIGGYLSSTDYGTLRLICRQWTEGLPKPKLGIANLLPNEIILQILELLPPIDYDAARHVCKSWFSAGLDYKIARNMLRYSGNYPAYLLDLDLEHEKLMRQPFDMHSLDPSEDDSGDADQEWLMSKRLATEARLSAAWRGPGVRTGAGHTVSNFSVVNVFDFRRLFSLSNHHTVDDFKLRNCTVSACGVYLLLIIDCEILVYSLCESSSPIAPVVRIVACRKVLAVSMDTSSGRYAVAALLEGRLGCSWDLKSILRSSSTMSQIGEPLDLGMRTDVQGLTSLGVSRPIPMRLLSEEPTQLSAPVSPHSLLDEAEGETIESLYGTVPYRTDSPDTMSDWINDEYEKDEDLERLLDSIGSSRGPVDIITRPTGLYANLGTSSDSPRSVAICPQRKCVAFGCRTGIELHWIDHVTASRLNR